VIALLLSIRTHGSLLVLSEQDRSRWDAGVLEEGFRAVECVRRGDALTRFHLEAGIATCHAAAPKYESTDWHLYDVLRERFPSPVVDVNRAVAVGLVMVHGAAPGLEKLDSTPDAS
jgi:RNA polymerase sigma-70 factor, ECF subfamily